MLKMAKTSKYNEKMTLDSRFETESNTNWSQKQHKNQFYISIQYDFPPPRVKYTCRIVAGRVLKWNHAMIESFRNHEKSWKKLKISE